MFQLGNQIAKNDVRECPKSGNIFNRFPLWSPTVYNVPKKLALVALYLQKKEGGRCGLRKAEQNNH